MNSNDQVLCNFKCDFRFEFVLNFDFLIILNIRKAFSIMSLDVSEYKQSALLL